MALIDKTYIVAYVQGMQSYDLDRSYWTTDPTEADELCDMLNRRNGVNPEDGEGWEVCVLECAKVMIAMLRKV